jgi:hypothetical protein
MITLTRRHAAAAVFTASGVFALAMGTFGLFRGLTPREALAGTGGLVVAAVAWLWLRRQNRNGDAP